MSTFQSQIKKAKLLESKLEAKIQKYSSLAQKINADFLCDEENPLIESSDEQELSLDIERDLNELAECITNMRNCSAGTTTPANHQEVLIKRYHEIHFDYSAGTWKCITTRFTACLCVLTTLYICIQMLPSMCTFLRKMFIYISI